MEYVYSQPINDVKAMDVILTFRHLIKFHTTSKQHYNGLRDVGLSYLHLTYSFRNLKFEIRTILALDL